MPQATRSSAGAAAFLLLGALASCLDEAPDPIGEGSGTELVGADGEPLPEGSVDCSADPRLDEYVQLDKDGERGVLSFHLEEVSPAPPAKGTNTFRLQVRDAGGAPLDGELRVDPRMPDHGHGTSVKPRISAAGGGEFTIEQLYLFMPGVWRIQLEAYPSGATAPIDRAALFFCIQG